MQWSSICVTQFGVTTERYLPFSEAYHIWLYYTPTTIEDKMSGEKSLIDKLSSFDVKDLNAFMMAYNFYFLTNKTLFPVGQENTAAIAATERCKILFMLLFIKEGLTCEWAKNYNDQYVKKNSFMT